MAYTINRRLSTLVDSNGQLNTGKIPNDYITGDHIADNVITSAMLHTSFTVSTSNLTSIDTDDVSEGSSNLYYTDARARGAVSATGSISYNSSTGVFSFTQGDTDTISEGSSNLYYTDARAQAVSINNVIEDTTPQLGGDLASNGNDILFADSDKAIFGAGSDLQIYHNGSVSYIDDAGTGPLVIRSNEIQLQKYTGETMASFIADGTVQLRYDNVAKLATTSTGIDVTGAVVATSFSDGTISGITFIDEDSFTTNSATRIPTQQSIKAYVDTQVAGVVDSAPAALDTLNELAAALGDDANFSTTTSTALGNRLRVDTAAQGLTGTQQANAITNLGITATKAELNYVDGVTSNIQTQLDGKQASGSYLTGNQTITLSGDVSGSGTTSIAVTIADDSHNHVISNVDGLQTALDAKLPLAGGTLTGSLRAQADLNYFGLASGNNEGEIIINTGEAGSPQIGFTEHGDASWAIGIDDADNSFKMHGTASNTIPTINNLSIPLFEITTTAGTAYLNNSRIFTDTYHPNADTLTTARTISLTGAVTGSVSFNGSSNVSIATTATADPTLTLSGDASGSATFTNLGNATLSVTVADDSHNHVISNIDGLQTALDAKLASSSYTAADVLTKIKTVDGSGSGLDADTVDGLQGTDIVETSDGVSTSLDTVYDAQMFGYSPSTGGTKPPTGSGYGQGISIVSTGKTHNNSNNWISQLAFSTAQDDMYFRSKTNAGSWGSWYEVWHTGNDGSGSGLDADTLDGLQLHTGTNNVANRVVRTDGNGYIQAGWINTISGATSSTLTRIYCSQDGYIRYQTPANFGVSISPHINYNTIANRPTLGGGTPYLDVATGNYGTVKVDDDRGVSWAGYAIRDDWVFMANGADTSGIYNDTDNEWAALFKRNAEVELFYNNALKMETTSSGISVTGNVVATGNVTAYSSDERLKTNITPIENPIEKVKQLNGVEFDWKDNVEELGFTPRVKHETGVIAQNVQSVIPDATPNAPFNEEYLTVQHEKIIPVLIEAIKEQQKQIDDLKQQINEQKEIK